MADYKAIKGHHIETVAGDPSTIQIGDIWYNSTLSKLRGGKLAAGAWASGGTLNTGRYTVGGAGASNTAALIFSGYTSPGAAVQALNESYDGSSWTEVADLNTARNDGTGCGIQTAALCIQGDNPSGILNITEKWDGSSWTEVGDLNTGRFSHAACGTVTAALVTGGRTPSHVGVTETYDGSSWTETGDLNTVRAYFAIAGTTTAALGAAGYNSGSPTTANSEEFDGSSWTEGNNVNTGRWGIGGTGTQTLALIYVGQPPFTGKTEEYDGSSWTEVADVPVTQNYGNNSVGTQSSALLAGGHNPPSGVLDTSYEWDKSIGASSITSS